MNKAYLSAVYKKLGVCNYSILYIYADLRYAALGNPKVSKDDLCRTIVAPILNASSAVLIPSFTYTDTGVFDVLTTRTKLGALNKWFLKQSDCVRSEHPLFSYAGLGTGLQLLRNIGKSAFGADSVFDRLEGSNAGFLHIGRPVSCGNTMLHYVEQLCGASYRHHKIFDTQVYNGSKFLGSDYSAFVRSEDETGGGHYTKFDAASRMLVDAGIVTTVIDPVIGVLHLYSFDQALDLMISEFYKNHYFFVEKRER